jgi:hypothetical protein
MSRPRTHAPSSRSHSPFHPYGGYEAVRVPGSLARGERYGGRLHCPQAYPAFLFGGRELEGLRPQALL